MAFKEISHNYHDFKQNISRYDPDRTNILMIRVSNELGITYSQAYMALKGIRILNLHLHYLPIEAPYYGQFIV